MPICPNCQREYKAGISRCEDCAVGLVESLTAEDVVLEESALELVELAEFMNPSEAELIRELLESNQISTVLRGEVDPIGLASGAAPSTLLVNRADLERANSIYEGYFAGDVEETTGPDEESGTGDNIPGRS
ncbi:MAG: putative prokaryotic signal transducing protein [Acidobacteria bacterium]|nr:putative prokaryotic signal transducing protein [Acidobacteriota bacterium]